VPTTPPAPAPGRLAVSPGGGSLNITVGSAAAITLTAVGGPVSWSIAVSGPLGNVSLSQSSGYLASGQSITVSVGAHVLADVDELTVSPAGVTFTVVAVL
jgi:hypothetical protein